MRSRVWKIVLAVVAVPVVIGALIAVQIVNERGCSAERLGDEVAARASAMWLDAAVSRLDGVRESAITYFGCRDVSTAVVVFEPTAGPDEVAAVARRTIDGLRGSAFAGVDVSLLFSYNMAAITAHHRAGAFSLSTTANLIGDLDGLALPPAGDLLAEVRAWAELTARYPRATVELGSGNVTYWDREVAVWGIEPGSVVAVFDVLKELGLPERTEMGWSVCTSPIPSSPRERTTTSFTVAGPLHEQAVTTTVAISDRLALPTPADTVHATLSWDSESEDGSPPWLKAFVELSLGELSDVPHDRIRGVFPTSSAPGKAEEIDTILGAAGLPYELEVRVAGIKCRTSWGVSRPAVAHAGRLECR